MIPLWLLAAPALATPWWTTLDDPGLEEVMERTLSGNLDLMAAWIRVEGAEARAKQARAGVLPIVTFDVGGQVLPNEGRYFGFDFPTQGGDDAPETYQSASAMFNAVVPLDVFGRQVSTWRATRYDALAQEGNAQAQAIQLTTLAAESWYDLVAATARLAVVEEQLRVSRELLELVELRYASGDGNALEVLQQRQQLAARQTLVPAARIGVRTAEQRLAVLVGDRPVEVDLPEVLTELPGLPEAPGEVDLTRTRPDLVAAALTHEAATALRRSAAKGALPSLAVTGGAGWQFYRLDELDSQATWQVGASLSMPLFGGLGAWNGYQEAKATEYGAELAWRSLVLTAEQEVAQARVVEAERLATLEAVLARAEAAELLYTESRSRYVAGLTDYLTVLNALDVRQQAQLDLVQARRDLLSSRIQLHDALGGAWAQDL